MAFAAARITSITRLGFESIGTWLLATSVVVAPIRLATNRSMSGWTVRSFLATMYQLGFEPDTSVRDFDVGEDVRFGEVRLLCLRCLVGVRSKRGDIDQPGNAVVR